MCDMDEAELPGELGRLYREARTLADPTDYHQLILSEIQHIADHRAEMRPANFEQLAGDVINAFLMTKI